MKNFIQINGRKIGQDEPTYIVAEMSANHHQKFDEAIKLVKAAKDAGADAIKLQTYTADTITLNCKNPFFRIGEGTIWAGRNLYDLYSEAYTPWEWQPKLKGIAEEMGLDCFSSPFDVSAVDFLEKMDVPAHKIASFELVDIPLLKKLAGTGKPLILSIGMASLAEIEEGVNAIRSASSMSGGIELVLLKCASAYPALPEEMNLRAIPFMADYFDVPVGLSDHTLGIAVPVAAIALGACMVEKHLTLSRSNPSPDSAFSLEPAEFKAMVEAVRTAEKALGEERYEMSSREEKNRIFRRSLFVVKTICEGEIFTEEYVRSIRPAYGLHPRHLPEVIGRKAAQDIEMGTPLRWDLIR